MRFQCRIGSGVQLAPPVSVTRPLPQPTPIEASPTPHRGHWPAQGALAGAALLAIAGCASLDAGVAKRPWKVEPVMNVQHAGPSGQAYYALGQYFDGMRDWSKAIDAYRKAIAVDAKHVEAYDALGVALAQSGRLADAEITLRQAVALAPDRARALNNLGYVLMLSGKTDEAVVTLKAAVGQDRGHPRAVANLREALGGATAAPEVAARADVPAAASEAMSPSVPVEQARAPASPVPAVSVALPASRLEISNGNGVPGLAARLRRELATQGIATERLSNQTRFDQRHSLVQYRAGHEEAALRVAHAMPGEVRADARPTTGLRSDVRVVIGHDWAKASEPIATTTQWRVRSSTL
jgi:tetratricopeptide (TPR) repeat protein